jgi:hypothetical protein
MGYKLCSSLVFRGKGGGTKKTLMGLVISDQGYTDEEF